MPALATVTAQVPSPLTSSIDGEQVTVLGPLTNQSTVPVGVPSNPETFAVKVKLPPAIAPAASSLTVVVEGAVATMAVVSIPELPL